MSNYFKVDKAKKEIWADWPTNFQGVIENMIAYDTRPHYLMPAMPDDWEDGKIVKEGVHFKFEDSCDKIRCHCPCHKNPGMIHIAACCKNGWIEMNKKTIAIPLPKEPETYKDWELVERVVIAMYGNIINGYYDDMGERETEKLKKDIRKHIELIINKPLNHKQNNHE